jgi:predicted permease
MWWRRRRADEDFAEEVAAHLELETDRLIADGWEPREARDAARRRFGNVLSAQERFHESTRWVWLEQAAQDVRYAWRGLRANPAFAATAILTLAVGLALVTVIFAVFNAYVLRPFAVRDPYALHQLIWRSQDDAGRGFRWRDYQELRGRRDLFDDVIADTTRLVTSKGRPLEAAFVSGNYFDALGVRLRLGRPIAPFDAVAPGGAPVAVLTDEGWGRLYNRDPTVLGRPLDVNGQRLTIVGITRAEFAGLDDSPVDFFAPITMYGPIANQDLFGADPPREIGIVARLRRDVTAAQMEAALASFVTRVVNRTDPVRAEAHLIATPNPLTVDLITALSPVFVAFGLVLAAACANVSNVMLARANARHREIGMRLSLGASRGRVVRQLLTEGLLIALVSGVAALGLAALSLRAGLALFFYGLPSSVAGLVRVVPLDLDRRVFLFAMAAATLTTTVFALLPALQATRISLMHALRGNASANVRGSTLRNLLVVGQVAVSLVLLVAAATIFLNGVTIGATNLGFETAGVFSVKQRLSTGPWIARAAETLKANPRIDAVGVTDVNPLSEHLPRMPLTTGTGTTGHLTPTSYRFVSPEYFDILRIPIVRGRGFTAAEARAEAHVAIVSMSGARALWPDEDPLGQAVRVQVEPVNQERGDRTWVPANAPRKDIFDVVVVGIAADVVSGMMVDGVDPSHLYLPTSPTGPRAAQMLFRGRSGDDSRPDRIQTLLRAVSRDPLAFEVLPLSELRLAQMFPVWAASWVGSVLGLIALALSVSGLYAVLCYTLSQRTREIGIRMALGATAAAVVRLVVSQSARMAGVGAVVGVAIAFGALQFLNAHVRFRNVSWLDAGAFAVGLALVALASVFASYLPARRATRVDPIETLRVE